jgi:hypothetical protein
VNLAQVLAAYEETGIAGHRSSLCSGPRPAHTIAAPGSRTLLSRKLAKLPNPHFASGKLRANLQLAPHCLDGFPQRAHENIGPAFDRQVVEGLGLAALTAVKA